MLPENAASLLAPQFRKKKGFVLFFFNKSCSITISSLSETGKHTVSPSSSLELRSSNYFINQSNSEHARHVNWSKSAWELLLLTTCENISCMNIIAIILTVLSGDPT